MMMYFFVNFNWDGNGLVIFWVGVEFLFGQFGMLLNGLLILQFMVCVVNDKDQVWILQICLEKCNSWGYCYSYVVIVQFD